MDGADLTGLDGLALLLFLDQACGEHQLGLRAWRQAPNVDRAWVIFGSGDDLLSDLRLPSEPPRVANGDAKVTVRGASAT